MNKLLIIEEDAPTYLKEVRKRNLPLLDIISADRTAPPDPVLQEADIIFGRPDMVAPLLGKAKNLKWMQSTFAGVEPLCQSGSRNDYILTGVKDMFGSLMSEHVFAYILARERNVFRVYENQKRHEWKALPYRGLHDLTIGIVGLGSIGRHIARTAAHFNLKVLGMKRTRDKTADAGEVYLPSDRVTFLRQLDYLVLTLPDTPDTRHFLRLEDMKEMKNTAVIISVGRGNNICESDLVEALREKIIGGAILDVFEKEPLAKESPLWDMEGVIITPHNSAFSFPERITDLFAANYRCYLANLPLNYTVDFKRGY